MFSGSLILNLSFKAVMYEPLYPHKLHFSVLHHLNAFIYSYINSNHLWNWLNALISVLQMNGACMKEKKGKRKTKKEDGRKGDRSVIFVYVHMLTDAHRNSHGTSSGGCGGQDDAALLPLRQQRHSGQQVRIRK